MIYTRAGEPFRKRVTKLSKIFGLFLSRAHGDFEQQNEVLGVLKHSIIIIIIIIIIILGPTQPPVQWIPGVLSPGVKRGRDVMLTTHPHLVPRS
jgi:hypothetical protein